MPNQLTNESTVDPADIGPEDLWLVWFKTLPLLQDLGEEPVSAKWALAARGSDGLQRLQEETAFGQDLVAAFPLSILQALRESLPYSESGGLIGWAKNALNIGSLVFVQDSQGNARIVFGEDNLQPGEKQLLSGDRKDFLRVVKEGEEILEKKNWTRIHSDHRPLTRHGEVGWLHYQRDPVGADFLNDILERHRSDG